MISSAPAARVTDDREKVVCAIRPIAVAQARLCGDMTAPTASGIVLRRLEQQCIRMRFHQCGVSDTGWAGSLKFGSTDRHAGGPCRQPRGEAGWPSAKGRTPTSDDGSGYRQQKHAVFLSSRQALFTFIPTGDRTFRTPTSRKDRQRTGCVPSADRCGHQLSVNPSPGDRFR